MYRNKLIQEMELIQNKNSDQLDPENKLNSDLQQEINNINLQKQTEHKHLKEQGITILDEDFPLKVNLKRFEFYYMKANIKNREKPLNVNFSKLTVANECKQKFYLTIFTSSTNRFPNNFDFDNKYTNVIRFRHNEDSNSIISFGQQVKIGQNFQNQTQIIQQENKLGTEKNFQQLNLDGQKKKKNIYDLMDYDVLKREVEEIKRKRLEKNIEYQSQNYLKQNKKTKVYKPVNQEMQRFNKRIQSASHIKTVQQRKDSIVQLKKIEILEKQQQKEMKMKNLTPNDYLDQIQFARKNVVRGGILRIQSAKNYSFFNKVDQISRKGQQNSQNNYSTISFQDREVQNKNFFSQNYKNVSKQQNDLNNTNNNISKSYTARNSNIKITNFVDQEDQVPFQNVQYQQNSQYLHDNISQNNQQANKNNLNLSHTLTMPYQNKQINKFKSLNTNNQYQTQKSGQTLNSVNSFNINNNKNKSRPFTAKNSNIQAKKIQRPENYEEHYSSQQSQQFSNQNSNNFKDSLNYQEQQKLNLQQIKSENLQNPNKNSIQQQQQFQSLNIPNYQLQTQSQNYQQDSIINNLQKQGIYEQYDLENQDENEEDEYI